MIQPNVRTNVLEGSILIIDSSLTSVAQTHAAVRNLSLSVKNHTTKTKLTYHSQRPFIRCPQTLVFILRAVYELLQKMTR